jgi:hypothetical protein
MVGLGISLVLAIATLRAVGYPAAIAPTILLLCIAALSASAESIARRVRAGASLSTLDAEDLNRIAGQLVNTNALDEPARGRLYDIAGRLGTAAHHHRPSNRLSAQLKASEQHLVTQIEQWESADRTSDQLLGCLLETAMVIREAVGGGANEPIDSDAAGQESSVHRQQIDALSPESLETPEHQQTAELPRPTSVAPGKPRGQPEREIHQPAASAPQSLDDLDLARAVAAGDPAAREEVRRRFTPIAILLARRICARIGHRGRRCPGLGCELAFLWVLLDLLDHFGGREPGAGRRGRGALIVAWLHGGPRTDRFADYVLGPAGEGQRGMLTEGRRAWNRARGLRVRANPSRDLERRGEAAYVALLAAPELASLAQYLGLDQPGRVWDWVDALFVDASETGLDDPIDIPRVARYLLGRDPSAASVQAVEPLARAVDGMLASHWPDWYDEHLSRPRQHTRRGVRPDVLGRTGT